MADNEITITGDSASPNLRKLLAVFQQGSPALKTHIMQDLGATCVQLTKDHVMQNGTNKRGWPSTGFYEAVAQKGVVDVVIDENTFAILIDHPDKSGAMKQRYYGGPIVPKEAGALTIPISPVSYGLRASDFENLFLLRTPKAAYLVQRGEQISPRSNNIIQTRKLGGNPATRIRAELNFLFILSQGVNQDPDPTVIPDEQDYVDACMLRLAHHFDEALN